MHSILIVEDEAVVALDLQLQLEDEGYRCVGPVRAPDAAIAIIDSEQVDFGILDVNLNGTTSQAIAERLAADGTPFVYLSGYGEKGILEELPKAKLIEKPVRIADLMAAIRSALG